MTQQDPFEENKIDNNAPTPEELLTAAKQVMRAQVEQIRFWHSQACLHRFYINAKEPNVLMDGNVPLFPTVDTNDARAMALYKLVSQELQGIYEMSEVSKMGINSPVAPAKSNIIIPK